MCICTGCVVVTIGLVLFNYGWFIIQFVRGKLWVLTPTHERTPSDISCEETVSQDAGKDECGRGGDEIDAPNNLANEVSLHCPNVKKSLQQVFECAYSQYILTWYSVPEPRNNQPLHNALGREYDLIVDRVIGRASDINVSNIAVKCIRILTQHLHDAKQPNRGQLFRSRADEITVLRRVSEALVRNLFPESLTAQDLTRSALNEILTLKVLEPSVKWLSDPNCLNQLIVSSLGGTMDDMQGLDQEPTPSPLDNEGVEATAEGTGDVLTNDAPKKKGSKFSKFIEKMKGIRKKGKPRKNGECVNGDPGDGIIQKSFASCAASYHQDSDIDESDPDESDPESWPPAVQLAYEMWRLCSWVVSIKQVQEEAGELSFAIHLEEAGNPEQLHWDVRKSQEGISLFYSSLPDCTDLPLIPKLLDSKEHTMNDEFKEQARVTLEVFLQKLVKVSQLGQSPEVFQFLCPLEQLLDEEEASGEVWSMLRVLAYLLTPAIGEEEDDPATEGPEPGSLVEMEDEEADLKGSRDALRRFAACSGRVPPVSSKGSGESREEAPSQKEFNTDLSGDDASAREDGGHQNDSTENYWEGVDGKDKQNPSQSRREKGQLIVRVHRAQEPNKRGVDLEEATKAVIDLVKEITGNPMMRLLINLLKRPLMPSLKKKVNSFLNKMDNTESQMASYIDLLREKKWPGGVPVVPKPAQTAEQEIHTKERALQLICSKCPVLILKKIEGVFKIFQDTEENKRLIYTLLSFLLGELMPGESLREL